MKATRISVTGMTLLLLMVTGCGSSPRSNHYLLTTDVSTPPDGETPSLGIGPVVVPEFLNRNSMVYSRQGNQLEISSTERWAEPLEAGIKRVVGINLASSLDTQDIRYFPWNAGKPPEVGISISLLSLDADDDEATLAAEWRVFRPTTGESVVRRISHLRLALPAGTLTAQQIAPAYSELLSQLSDLIAGAIEQDLAANQQN
jgi:uncharacterized lipoprotein YmbA